MASDGSGTQQRQPSPNTRRRMASAAVQGLRGTFFQHGSFLELVSHLQKQALFTTGVPSSSPPFNAAALAVILILCPVDL